MNKLLLTIFTILFTVLVFEFGYFFGMERMKTQVVKGAPQFEEKSISIITMVKSFFTDGQNGKLSNLNLSYTYTGTIEKVSFEPQKIASGDFAFAPTEAAASIYIKTKDGTSRGFYFYESELANIKFLEKSKGGELREITHSSFKTGDKASLTTIINLLRPPTDNLIKVELIKNP